MSEEALLQAVRDDLRQNLGYLPAQCDVETDYEPPPSFGELYVAICPASWESGSQGGNDFWERIALEVHVIVRAMRTPLDRQGTEFLLKNLTSLNARARAIAVRVNMNYDIMDAANELSRLATGDVDQQGFHHPLKWLGCTLPKPMSATVWGATAESGAAFYRTIRFGEAERIQPARTAV